MGWCPLRFLACPVPCILYLLVSYRRHASAVCSTSISALRSTTSGVFSVGLNRVSLGAPSVPFMPCSQSAITPKMIMQGPCQPDSCFCTLLPALFHPPLSLSLSLPPPLCTILIPVHSSILSKVNWFGNDSIHSGR